MMDATVDDTTEQLRPLGRVPGEGGDEPSPRGRVITTPDGLPGFDDLHSWHLERHGDDAVFALLRSIDRPGIGLLVAEPWGLAPGYEPDLPDPDLLALGAERVDDVSVLVVANLDVERHQAWLNLAAPIVVHGRTGAARQMILDRQGWPIRHPVALAAGA